MNNILKNIAIATAGAGTAIVVLSWNGGETLSKAAEFINKAVTGSEMFKTNEDRLIEKINELKKEKSLLENQLNGLIASNNADKETITELGLSIEKLNQDINEANIKLAESDAAIEKANAEIKKANDDAEVLQGVVDEAENNLQVSDKDKVDNVLEENKVYEEISISSNKVIINGIDGIHVTYYSSENGTGRIVITNGSSKELKYILNDKTIIIAASGNADITDIKVGTTFEIGTLRYKFV